MPLGVESPLRFRRTKIVATLGPSSNDDATVSSLISAGVNVFRLNMSHGSHDEHRVRFALVRSAAARLGVPVAVLADLCGPKIRVGQFEHGQVLLSDGARVVVTTRPVLGNDTLIVSQYNALPDDVVVKDRLLLDDGAIELEVLDISGSEIECVVLHGGTLRDKKGMNLPGVRVSAPALTEKDRADALFARELGVDFVALSFVRKSNEIHELRDLLGGASVAPLIVAKIEKPEALDVIDEIIAASDAIMVARGDLGVELDPARVPNIQEELVDAARAARKPVIVATQMLESMIRQARPTRAEVTDVANAVRSGADAVMLSAETAAGAHPVQAVATMDLIIRRTEDYLFSHGAFASIESFTPTAHETPTHAGRASTNPEEAVAAATARMSRELVTSAIVVDGQASNLLSSLCADRPAAMVFALSGVSAQRGLGCLAWGVQPIRDSDTGSGCFADRAKRAIAGFELELPGGFVLVVASGTGKDASLTVVPG